MCEILARFRRCQRLRQNQGEKLVRDAEATLHVTRILGVNGKRRNRKKSLPLSFYGLARSRCALRSRLRIRIPARSQQETGMPTKRTAR